MKIEEFSLTEIPGTETASCEIDKYWKPAADGSKIAIGTKAGAKYQVKVRATEPKWKNNAGEIAKLEAELARTTDEMERERIEKKINGKRKKTESEDKLDAIYDDFLNMKDRLRSAVRSSGCNDLIIAEAVWKQPIDWISGSICYCEVTPWQTVKVGDGCPVRYADAYPTLEARYKVVAALAESLAKLHALGIRHNDIKRPNTLILDKDKPRVALIDFDAAFFLKDFVAKDDNRYHAKMWNLILGGTYFAPEMLKFSDGLAACDSFDEKNEFMKSYDYGNITMASDIFSLGITAYEYIFDVENPQFKFVKEGEEPVISNDYGTMILNGYEIEFPDEVKGDPFLFAAMRWMLAADPNDRPTAEQVAKAFTSGSLDDISEKFLPEDLSTPWEEDHIEMIPEKIARDNVEIKRIRGLVGRYQLFHKTGNYGSTVRKERLISDGYAKPAGSDSTASAVDESTLLWDCDLGKTTERTLPAGVKRFVNGKYRTNKSLYPLTFEELKAKGYFCADADKFKLWPDDEPKGTINIPGRIERNVEKGSGEYILISKDGSTREYFNFDRLVRAGHITLKETREIGQPWSDEYEFVIANIPADVISIVRAPNFLNQSDHTKYRVVQNGATKTMRVEELVTLGWLRKK